MAKRSLGTLTVDLIARVHDFVAGMDKAERASAKTAQKITDDFDRMKKSAGMWGKNIAGVMALGATAVLAGATAAAGAFTVYSRSVLDEMDELSKASQKVGMSTEAFSALNYAASLADVETDALVKTLGKLTKAQADAAQGGAKMTEVFNTLGIDAVDPVTGKMRDSIDVLKDFADVFVANQGSPEVMALGLQLFGKSFQDLVPLLLGGAEGINEVMEAADRLGITLTTAQGQAAEAFNDSLTSLSMVTRALAYDLLGELVPAITQNIIELGNWIGEGDRMQVVLDGIRTAIDMATIALNASQIAFTVFKTVVQNAANVIITLAGNLMTMAGAAHAAWKALMSGNPAAVMGAIENGWNAVKTATLSANVAAIENQQRSGAAAASIKDDLNSISDAWSGTRRQANNAADAFAGVGQTLKDAIRRNGDITFDGGASDDAAKDAAKLNDEYAKLTQNMDRQIALGNKSSEEAKVRWEIEKGGYKSFSEQQKQELISRAKLLDAQKELNKETKKGGGGGKGGAAKLSDEQKEIKKFLEDYDRLMESMTERLAMIGLTTEAEKVAHAVSKGYYSEEQKRVIEYTEAQKEGAIELAKQIDLKQELYDEQRKAEQQAKRQQEDAKETIEDLQFEISLMNKSVYEQEQMNMARRLGNSLTQEHIDLLSKLQMAESIRDVNDDLMDMEHEFMILGKTADEQDRLNYARKMGIAIMSEEGQLALRNLEILQQATKQVEAQVEVADAVRGSVAESMRGLVSGTTSWKDAIVDLFDTFNAKILEIITNQWTEKLFGGMGSTFGGTVGGGEGSWLNKLTGGLTGGMDMGKATGQMAQESSLMIGAGTELTMAAGTLNAAALSLQGAAASWQAGALSGATTIADAAGTLDTSTGTFSQAMVGGAGGGGGFMGWIKGLFSGGGGGGSAGGWMSMLGGLFGGGMATGGWAAPNTLYEVNEQGPEMFSVGARDYMMTGRKGVQVTPNHQLGGGMAQTNNFVIQGRIDRRTEQQVAMSVGRKSAAASRRNS